MDYGTFTRRFREEQEMGRDVTETELSVYRDNGSEVGVWREHRASTCGRGEVLSPEDAQLARYWFRDQAKRSR